MDISGNMGVRFRLMTAADIPQAMQLKDAAGWNQTRADWLRFLSAKAGSWALQQASSTKAS